ncbi:MAG: nitrilase-related carbon-nitrogen hydrolase [Pirellulales bacterium]
MLIDPAGQIAARYRKRHLFNIDLTEQVVASEGDVFTPGDALACVTTPCGTLGWGICFDLRFPEQFRTLSRMGTEVFVVPSAFTQTTGRDHWELLLRTGRRKSVLCRCGRSGRQALPDDDQFRGQLHRRSVGNDRRTRRRRPTGRSAGRTRFNAYA